MTGRIVERGSSRHRITQLVVLAVVIVVVFVVGTGVQDYQLQLLTQAVALSLAILGMNLVAGYGGQLSLGHNAFLGLGSYTTAILVADHGWSFWATLPVSLVLGLIAGLIVGVPLLRVRGLYLALLTLSLGVIFPIVASQLDFTGGANGKPAFVELDRPATLAVTSVGWGFICAAACVVPLFWLTSRLVHSRAGRSLEAQRDNELGAAASGINLGRTKTLMFAYSAGLASVAGSVFVLAVPVVSPESLGFALAVQLVLGMAIGGMATVSGAIIGGLAVVWIPFYTSEYSGDIPGFSESSGATLSNAVYGIVLIVIVFLMPGGIGDAGRKLAKRFVLFVPPGTGPRKDTSTADAITAGPVTADDVRRDGGASAIGSVPVTAPVVGAGRAEAG